MIYKCFSVFLVALISIYLLNEVPLNSSKFILISFIQCFFFNITGRIQAGGSPKVCNRRKGAGGLSRRRFLPSTGATASALRFLRLRTKRTPCQSNRRANLFRTTLCSQQLQRCRPHSRSRRRSVFLFRFKEGFRSFQQSFLSGAL